MTPELRPVGSEYWGAVEFPGSGTEAYARQFKYKVVSHDLCVRSAHPKAPTFTTAQIKPIGERRAEIVGWNLKTGERTLGEWYDA